MDPSFGSEAFAPEKLAPPGTAPPPNPGLEPTGEEGAILEPNAPTQNPDFFPNLKTEGELPPPGSLAKPAVARRPQRSAEPDKVPTSENGADTLLKGLEAVLQLGPIVVPRIDSASFKPEPAAEAVRAAPIAPASASAQADVPRLLASTEEVKEESLQSGNRLSVKPNPRNLSDEEPPAAKPSYRPGVAKEPVPIPKPEIESPGSIDARRKPHGEGEKPFESTAGRRMRDPGPLRPGPDTASPTEAPLQPDSLDALKIEDVTYDGDDRLLGRIPEDRPLDPSAVKPEAEIEDAKETVPEQGVTVIPKPRIDPADGNKEAIDAQPVSKDDVAKDATPASDQEGAALDRAGQSAKPRRMKSAGGEGEPESKIQDTTRHEAKTKDPVPAERSAVKDDFAGIHANRGERAASPDPAIAKPSEKLNDAQTRSILGQVAERLDSLAASQSNRRVTIHLEPESFGSITLVVRQSGSDVDAEVYASHDSVRAALEVNRAHLAANLDQRGIQLGSMTVGHELPHHSGRQEEAMREAAKQHSHLFAGKPETTPLTLEAMRSFARKPSGVDLWI